MPVLTSQQRKLLEDACVKGRRASEQAVRAALTSLAVAAERPPAHLDEDDRQLRRGLRAKSRQLGDRGDKLELLIAECAYEQWHRLLFARFLAENNLLIHPEYHAPLSLADCEELAESLQEPDGWSVAARFAAEILPGIFRLEDPCVRMRLAPEGRLALEGILVSLPADVFAADDALGWVYQFWQKDRKNEVNASERKIGGADLGPVTQLFTENYIVRFLLENSLGAWWARRRPASPLVKSFEYLRFDESGRPAAGTFEGWPDAAGQVTVMDPCCGSGHFLVEAFDMLWRMRAEEESLSPLEAQDSVLRDNLFGLELDPRCVQIAMFTVALHAWKVGGGWRELPVPNVACAGMPVNTPVDDWKALANGDRRIEEALVRLHILFREADTLGSLIDPRRSLGISGATAPQTSFDEVEWEEVAPLMAAASRSGHVDPGVAVLGGEASSLARAADYLSSEYTLVATNVPFLSRKAHGNVLGRYIDLHYPDSKTDLATAMLERCWGLSKAGGSVATVSPVHWLFLRSFRQFRRLVLGARTPHALARLGPRAFSGISGEIASVTLFVDSTRPASGKAFAHIDVTDAASPALKAVGLQQSELEWLRPDKQLTNPDSVISASYEGSSSALLSDFADGYAGIQTGDLPRFVRMFWEVPDVDGTKWAYYQGTVEVTREWGGLEKILLWEGGKGSLHNYVAERLGGSVGAWIRGTHCVGKVGVSVSQMGQLPVALYSGERFDPSNAVVLPRNPDDLPAIWQFCRSTEFSAAVRSIDQSLKVTNATLVKVPFDIDRWRKVAAEEGPLSLPSSEDPTQWVFKGRPETSSKPLQVAVARLLGYRWPEQVQSDDLDALADADGIVCLPSVAGEPPAADRLQQLLGAAFRSSWSPAKNTELLEETGTKKKNLADWLRDDFFKQHCALFGHRPFIWHVWDGQSDGFAALVNYHRLDRKTLEKLTYTYLGDWIERQRAEVGDEKPGAEMRLAAASKLRESLELILDGEPPYDIYVRWKSLAEQPIGWDPDVDDGVRVNVRPFVEAGVLRSSFNVHWRKDRGKNPDGSERLNDLHVTTAEKRASRGSSA